MKHKISFLPDNLEAVAMDGEDILAVLTSTGLKINASCGGAGTCARCKLILEKGKIEGGGRERLDQDEVEAGYFLACKASAVSDLVVRIPDASRQNDLFESDEGATSLAALEDSLKFWLIDMPVKKVQLKLPKPNLTDSVDDLRRLKRVFAIKIASDKEILADLDLVRSLAKAIRDADFLVTVSYIETASSIEIIRVEAGDTTKDHFAVAVDVGTTTIGASLIDLVQEREVASLSSYNGQANFGDDVISRIIFAAKPNGLTKLKDAVVVTISGLITGLLEKSGRTAGDISAIFLAGNTIMTHLLLGIDPKYIREEPYIPTAVDFPWMKAADLNLDILGHARAFVFPSVASYVGGDVVAGVVANRISSGDKLTLYIDVGTNGEIVLGNSDWLMACSCSAGPAFEGGGVKDGMKAAEGAIEKVEIDEESLEARVSVIGGVKPSGICGSGLIDLLAELFLKRVVDQRGKIDPALKGPRIRENGGGLEYIVAFGSETASGRDIVIGEADIDNLLRAKAAVFAGVTMLLESMSLNPESIDEILIAGSFGRYLNVEKIQIIGMLFETEAGKVRYVGNGSLSGATLAALSKQVISEAEKVAERMTYLELSADPKFMDAYISALFLPHTDVELFPSVMERFKAAGT
ncbi:MAG: ASKHA domain-containing protein [Actinomycetota bacterium]|nr:ASKHA domain-containing protein [Actinomycetota bacterium]